MVLRTIGHLDSSLLGFSIIWIIYLDVVLDSLWVDIHTRRKTSITTGRCDLAIATYARKMHKKYQYDCQLEYFS